MVGALLLAFEKKTMGLVVLASVKKDGAKVIKGRAMAGST